jgi:ERCC4-type nuclease
MGYIPRPADNERAATALCMARSVGEKTAFALMADYGSIANLCTASLDDLADFRQDGRRIGQKKAEAIIKLLHSKVLSRNDPHIKERT